MLISRFERAKVDNSSKSFRTQGASVPALLLGSISTRADTSELQRAAFNQAFADHGVDWTWGRTEYQQLLTGNGGADRIAAYAAERGEEVDAEAIHRTKSELFQKSLAGGGMPLRPGVVETITAARADGWQVGLVTTTSRDNVSALLGSLDGVSEDDFDVVTDVTSVPRSKPSPEVYQLVLQHLDLEPTDCVAVEDNVGGVESATGAGVTCLAFPNANTASHDFGSTRVVDRLTLDEVRAAAEGGK
jgi:HAD superfamily hydrolase (TIGR01509 family)